MSAKSQAGTPEWTAPEVLRGQVSSPSTQPSCVPHQKFGRVHLAQSLTCWGKQVSASSYACSLLAFGAERD